MVKAGLMRMAFQGRLAVGGGRSPGALWAKDSPGTGASKYSIKGHEVEGSGAFQNSEETYVAGAEGAKRVAARDKVGADRQLNHVGHLGHSRALES